MSRVYGLINLRTDGRNVLLAYKLERPNGSVEWDVHCLEPDATGTLQYAPEPVDRRTQTDAGKGRLSRRPRRGGGGGAGGRMVSSRPFPRCSSYQVKPPA